MNNTITGHMAGLDLPLHRNFVAPILCKDLVDLGIKPPPLYKWKLINGDAIIWSIAFDPDGYYNESEQYIDVFSKIRNIGAFSIGDMEMLMPCFNHHCCNKKHTISLKNIQGPAQTAPRYADALALVIIELVRSGTLSTDHANEMLTTK